MKVISLRQHELEIRLQKLEKHAETRIAKLEKELAAVEMEAAALREEAKKTAEQITRFFQAVSDVLGDDPSATGVAVRTALETIPRRDGTDSRALLETLPEKTRELLRLGQQLQASLYAQDNARKRNANDPAHKAMLEIRDEFERWQSHAVRYANDADFAKKMHANHATAITNEGSIKNAVARWRNNRKSSC